MSHFVIPANVTFTLHLAFNLLAFSHMKCNTNVTFADDDFSHTQPLARPLNVLRRFTFTLSLLNEAPYA